MGAIDAGYDLIYNYRDKEVYELYLGNRKTFIDLVNKKDIPTALLWLSDAEYYSSILRERNFPHKLIPYEAARKLIDKSMNKVLLDIKEQYSLKK